MLGIAKKAVPTVESLNLLLLLNCSDKLFEQNSAITALNARAIGEASIREAMRQLVVWGLERK